MKYEQELEKQIQRIIIVIIKTVKNQVKLHCRCCRA